MVPVVFHVIHQNGPENVSDSVLQAEIVALNQYFSNSGPYFQATGVDVGIQFCLASVDPFGNSTNGITRDFSSYAVVNYGASQINDIYMKNVNRWNPMRYLNIWIVKEILGFANAYSSLPNSLGSANDGVVITGTSLGGIHYLIAHEVGHYLGLNHHFVTGNCNNGNCLLDGDNICDTPPELPNSFDCSVSTCSSDLNDTTGFSPFTTDVPDLSTMMSPKQNCLLVFTQNQADRMYASLTQIRTLLLSSNGCGGNFGGTVPTASFITSEFGCNSTYIDYTGTPYEYIEWDKDNDGYFETQADSFGTGYPQTGYYTIILRVFGSAGADTDTQTVYVRVRPTTNYPLQSTQGGVVPGGVCNGTTITFTAVPGMVSYLWSNGDTTQSTSYVADSSFYMTLTCIDSTGYVWQRCPMPTVFYQVFPPINKPIIYSLTQDSLCFSDTISVTANLNQGQTRLWWIINGFNSFLPFDTMNIYTPYTSNYNISMLIQDTNLCTTYLDTLSIYADPIPQLPYEPYYFSNTIYGFGGTSWHHQFYLDGVAISGADSSSLPITQPGCYSVFSYNQYPHCGVMSDTICFWVVGENNLTLVNNYKIFPNPVFDELSITFNELINNDILKSLKITNLLGESIPISINQQNSSSMRLNLLNLSSGIYQLSIQGKTQKFIKLDN
jgi:PKD repeat protein